MPRRFVLVFLVVTFAVLATIGALNYVVNPEGTYSTRMFPPILWGARPEKANLLPLAQPPPQALILGSSRVMNLPPSAVQRVTGLVTFNAGVNSAKPEDYFVMLRYAVEKARLAPRLVIIGVDVEGFHDHEPWHLYLAEPTLLGSLMPRSERFWRWRSFTRLFTHFETGLSLTSLWKIASGHTTRTQRLDPDGLTHFDDLEKTRNSGTSTQAQTIQATVQRFIPRYDEYTGVSAERIGYLNDTLAYAHDHHIQVITFLTPTHPEVAAGLAQHGYFARQREVVATMRAASQKWGVPFYDLSDPDSFGGKLTDFYDGVHYDEFFAQALAEGLTQRILRDMPLTFGSTPSNTAQPRDPHAVQ